jgi:sugar phosphate permease
MKVRHAVLGMLVLLSVVTYLDRIAISVSAKEIQADLNLSKSQWGWVLGAFLLAYGLFEIPSGGLGDRIGQRKVLTRIVLWWSAFTAITALARNYYMLVATRFLFGAGEAGAYPNASGCISRWFPAAERARAQGLIWGASRLGGALTPIIVIPLKAQLGWRACFWLFGALGVVWAVSWVRWFRDKPADHPAISPHELAELNDSNPRSANGARPTDDHHKIPWLALFSQPQLWLIIAMYWFYVWGFIFFMYWLPDFLTQGRGMSDAAMGTTVALMYIMGFFGNLIGGWASDRLSRQYGLAIGRKVIAVTCLALCSALLFIAAFVPGQIVTAALMIAAFGLGDGMLPCAWAICLDVGRNYSGAVSGAMNSAGQAAGYFATVLYGYLVTSFGYDGPLLFFAPSILVGAVLFALIDPTRPLVADEAATSSGAEEPACA